MGNMSGDYGSHYTLWQSITQNGEPDVANNKTNVTVRMYLSFDGSSYYSYTNYETSGSMTIDGTKHDYSIASINFSSGQAKDILLAEWTGDISHNSDGTKTLSVSGTWNTDTSRIGSGTCTASTNLTTITRYANITSFSVSNISGGDGLTKVKFSWSVDTTCDYAWYSTDGGNTWNNLPANNIVSGLSPNTSYNFRLRLRRSDNWLTTDSSIVTKSTYDIARISSFANFEHGSNPTLGITNPANISSLSLVMKVGDTQILTRTVIAGNNTITFSDRELDNLYKKYGSSSSLTATFVLTGSGYTNTKTCTITLKGNQKTMKMNVSSSWKRGKLWLNISTTWRRAIVWQNVNGTWRRGI